MKLKLSTLVFLLVIVFLFYHYYLQPQYKNQDDNQITQEDQYVQPPTVTQDFAPDGVTDLDQLFGYSQYENFNVTPIELPPAPEKYTYGNTYDSEVYPQAGNVRPDNYTILE